jgi:hypothetical protein
MRCAAKLFHARKKNFAISRMKVKRFVHAFVLAACKNSSAEQSRRVILGSKVSKMVSSMSCVDFQYLLAWQSAESWMRSEAAGVIQQSSNTCRECFHFDCIFQSIWRNKDRSRSYPTRRITAEHFGQQQPSHQRSQWRKERHPNGIAIDTGVLNQNQVPTDHPERPVSVPDIAAGQQLPSVIDGERSRLVRTLIERIDHDPAESMISITLSPTGLQSFSATEEESES